jgi:hypothetical protein
MLLYVIAQAAIVMFVTGRPYGIVLFFYMISALFIGAIALIPPKSEMTPLQLFRISYPLFLLTLFYYIIDSQTRIFGVPSHDSFFNSLEKNLFGVYPTFALQRIMEMWLNNLSYILYCLGIAIPLITITILYHKKDMRLYANYILAMSLGCGVCLIISSLVPVIGPYRALQNYYYLGIYGKISEVASFFLGNFTATYGTFPAIYFCVIAISSFYLWDFGKIYVYLTFTIMTGVFWGGVYLRYHYLLDGLTALVIAFISVAIASYVHFRTTSQQP